VLVVFVYLVKKLCIIVKVRVTTLELEYVVLLTKWSMLLYLPSGVFYSIYQVEYVVIYLRRLSITLLTHVSHTSVNKLPQT